MVCVRLGIVFESGFSNLQKYRGKLELEWNGMQWEMGLVVWSGSACFWKRKVLEIGFCVWKHLGKTLPFDFLKDVNRRQEQAFFRVCCVALRGGCQVRAFLTYGKTWAAGSSL